MKKKKTNPWTIVGIIIAIILLIYWLLAATVLEEDENVIPILDGKRAGNPLGFLPFSLFLNTDIYLFRNDRVKRYSPGSRKK